MPIDKNSSPIFEVGDKVLLTDQKGKEHSITLQSNQEWHTHKGVLLHNDLIGKSQGIVVETNQSLKFTAFKQLLSEFVLNMPRGATIIYPKDSAAILGLADIGPWRFSFRSWRWFRCSFNLAFKSYWRCRLSDLI